MRSSSTAFYTLALVPLAASGPLKGFSSLVSRINIARPKIGTVPYNADITACNVPGTVALTYDDGPGPYTEELLQILESNNVKATFFINGNNGQGPITDNGFARVIKKAYDDGHQIASHTWSHADLAHLSTEERTREMTQLEDALESIIGVIPTYMRPPYTSCEADCMQDMDDLGYHVANYNIDTRDWAGDYNFAREVYSSALSSSSPSSAGFIELTHDIHAETVHTFTQFMIDEAREHGYKLVTLGECLGDPVSNWYRKS
ncbi:hypothetical protein JX265_003677 [Neoarthrinium moseri]|uniref:NodB homology domain-containing protein n=1 Tax=Neoarthrinium moseri TaxID=1658444 RepID=A0A9Q0ATQ7_9PEZI|nr:uncharacterized protein JN550_002422 [Neoarthrinium moseri]KAI1854000.1 hypothetical protein JX266_001141 [Neoarthrinium moseri]KAI1874993.1 hypothetical protein JN550_002422 [Neoarthrinium moseri]KAI1877669.1 hypothetical protein JX265_003677 [Neoarthrinium moseri]